MRAAINTPHSLCPRCGAPFRCGVADAEPCACSTLPLDAAQLAALRTRFTGCLCVTCLSALARTPHEPSAAAPRHHEKGRPGGDTGSA